MAIRLEGSETIDQLFGSWPSFHDAEILRIEIDRSGPRVAIDLLMPRPRGSARDISIKLLFHEVDDLSLSDFNHQNVISYLDLEPTSNGRMKVTFEPIFGAAFSFTCMRGEVLHAAPCDLPTGHPL
jgi:hypothetical protein